MGKLNNSDDQKNDSNSVEKITDEDSVVKSPDFSSSLIFIDTNVFLDFYRIRNSDVSIKLLDEILKHKDSVIITSQIEMEFKKNRQIVFGQTYTELTKTRNFSLNLPHILTVEEEVKDFNETKKKLNEYQTKLENKFAAILINPLENDQVYKKLDELFAHKSEYNLNRDNIANTVIAELARKRFDLGYPPRKESDNSIGDSINWEWIIQCAKTSQKPVIIITRDSDYGYIFNKEPYLNDWLAQEFRDRSNGESDIFLTNKITKAFEIIKINVTKEMVEEEQKIISTNDEWQYQNLRDREASWLAADRNGFTPSMESLYSSRQAALKGSIYTKNPSLSPSLQAIIGVSTPKPSQSFSTSPKWQTIVNAPKVPPAFNMLNNFKAWDNKIPKNLFLNRDD